MTCCFNKLHTLFPPRCIPETPPNPCPYPAHTPAHTPAQPRLRSCSGSSPASVPAQPPTPSPSPSRIDRSLSSGDGGAHHKTTSSRAESAKTGFCREWRRSALCKDGELFRVRARVRRVQALISGRHDSFSLVLTAISWIIRSGNLASRCRALRVPVGGGGNVDPMSCVQRLPHEV